MWGIRVVIPAILQQQVLESLHSTHSGITRMKAMAWSHFWWRGLDKDIETLGNHVRVVRTINPTRQWYHYTHGCGLTPHGKEYI